MHTVDEEWLMVLYKNRDAKQKKVVFSVKLLYGKVVIKK